MCVFLPYGALTTSSPCEFQIRDRHCRTEPKRNTACARQHQHCQRFYTRVSMQSAAMSCRQWQKSYECQDTGKKSREHDHALDLVHAREWAEIQHGRGWHLVHSDLREGLFAASTMSTLPSSVKARSPAFGFACANTFASARLLNAVPSADMYCKVVHMVLYARENNTPDFGSTTERFL